MRPPYRVGLTGGIASGKTTVTNLFADLGATIVDTDLLAREVVAPGTSLLSEIASHFGGDIIASGALDRRKLRDRVFADPAERRWLEERTHPVIRELTDQRCRESKGPYCVVAIPLLVETGGANRFDRVLVVDCDPEVQVSRLMARDDIDREAALRMLAAQASREDRLAVADDVIRNDGEMSSLHDQVKKLHLGYVAAAAKSGDSQSAGGAT